MTKRDRKHSNKKNPYDLSTICDSDSDSSSSCSSSSSSSSSCSSSSSSSSCSSSSSSSSCSSSSSSGCSFKCNKNGGCSDGSCSTPSDSSLISSLSDSSDSTPSSRWYRTDFSKLKSDESSCSSSTDCSSSSSSEKCCKKSKCHKCKKCKCNKCNKCKCGKKHDKSHKYNKSNKCPKSLLKDLLRCEENTLVETVHVERERKHHDEEHRRHKEFNIYFKDCRGHKSRDWCPNNGQAIWIEGLLSPNLNLKVGDVCYFRIHQEPNRDGKYENSFVLTESSVAGLPGVKVQPLNGFEVTHNGTIKYTVDERTPKHFYYQSANSTCLGGRVFITSNNAARKYRK